MTRFLSHSPEETLQFGAEISAAVQPGDILLLEGDLGVGKTVFTKGFGKGLGIREPIVSPTFTILKTYEEGRLPLYHVDAYRIDDPDEMLEIGLEEYLYGNGVTLIEWPSKIASILPSRVMRISLKKDPTGGDNDRIIEIED